jgi:signal peptidase II
VRDLQAARGATLTGSNTASVPDRPDGGPGQRRLAPQRTADQHPVSRLPVVLGVAIVVLALDIVSKTIVVATLSGGRTVRLLGGLLTLLESRNPGAAFSLGGPSETIVFSAIAVGVAIFIVRAARRIQSLAWAVALGLLLGGATGNLTDRIFRAPGPFRGWVVDWIQLPHWPVFNLADSAITCGGVLIVLLAVFGRGLDGATRAADDLPEASPGPAQPDRSRSEATRPDDSRADLGRAAEAQAGQAVSEQPWQENPTGRG